jgi:hypothetical protein
MHEGPALALLMTKHCCNQQSSVPSMRAQQFGAGRLDHPAQSSLLTYLAICTAQIANMLGLVSGRCPHCVLVMLAMD